MIFSERFAPAPLTFHFAAHLLLVQYLFIMSVISVGQGGADYDEVAEGNVRNYCYNMIPLVQHGSFTQHVMRLVTSIDRIIADIELQSNRQINAFVIGKTSCPARSGVFRMNQTKVLDAQNWKGSAGPGNRWNELYRNQGYHGLVVICGVTSDLRPLYSDSQQPIIHQTQYALALEQALTHHYLLEKRDIRCKNHSLASGSTGVQKTNAIGVVYFAFQLEDKEEKDDDEDDDEEEDDEEVDGLIDFLQENDLVNQFLKRIQFGDELPSTEEYTEAVGKYDSLSGTEQERCVKLWRGDEEANSDDEDDVQALVGFVSNLDDDDIKRALLLHARYGSEDSGDVDSALVTYDELSSTQQHRVMISLV